MDQADRDVIRSNIGVLSDDMDFESVSTFLYSGRIFEKGHIEAFAANKNQKKRNLELLLAIETRGPEAFRSLVEALLAAKQPFLAEKLGYSPPTHSGVQVQASTSHEPVWPSPDNNGDYSSSQVDTFTSYLPNLVHSDDVYKMNSRPRGLAFIVNNENFKKMPLRRGTNVDCNNLENIFRQLGFEVESRKDLTGKEIKQILEHLRRIDHSKYDCFILAILSHGEEGLIHGTDSVLIRIEEIISLFNADRCPSLKGKPKLFFLQACRGERKDTGVDATDVAGPAGDGEQLAQMMLRVELDSTDSLASTRDKLPSQSDMLLAYATVPGYVSWRNSERGSWFIQALTEVILDHAQNEDLLSMMTRVNAKVARAFESSCGRHKQIPAPVTMLTKKLYFFPDHYE